MCFNADCLNARVRSALSPAAGLGLGLYPSSPAPVKSPSASAAGGLAAVAGLNAAASELARLSDRAMQAAAAATPSLLPGSLVPPGSLTPGSHLIAWSLPALTTAGIGTQPTDRLGRTDCAAAPADDQNKHLDDHHANSKQRSVVIDQASLTSQLDEMLEFSNTPDIANIREAGWTCKRDITNSLALRQSSLYGAMHLVQRRRNRETGDFPRP